MLGPITTDMQVYAFARKDTVCKRIINNDEGGGGVFRAISRMNITNLHSILRLIIDDGAGKITAQNLTLCANSVPYHPAFSPVHPQLRPGCNKEDRQRKQGTGKEGDRASQFALLIIVTRKKQHGNGKQQWQNPAKLKNPDQHAIRLARRKFIHATLRGQVQTGTSQSQTANAQARTPDALIEPGDCLLSGFDLILYGADSSVYTGDTTA